MAVHFNCCPSELDEDQMLDYLLYCKNQHKTPSESFFKHTVYGLRALFKIKGKKKLHLQLPEIQRSKKLPIVLSQQEIKHFIRTPKLLKHRVFLALIYDCGLRQFEALNLQLSDLDFDRKMVHVREGKGKKDRYLPLGEHMIRGIKKYIKNEHPEKWLFMGNDNNGNRTSLSKAGAHWIVNQACKKSGIDKKITCHTLRHSYATHLLELGLDIVSLKELLGHSCIETTMIYLHICQFKRSRSFSPLDVLYQGDSDQK